MGVVPPPAPPPRPSRLPDRRTMVEDEEPRRRSIGPYAVLVLLALIIAAAAGYFATRPGGVPRVTVGNYVGMTDVQAQQSLANAGLHFKSTRQSNSTVPINHVVSQDPAPNTDVTKDEIVQLVVSSGKPTVGLRDVTGFTFSDAQKDLISDKFQVKVVRKFDPSAKDTVIAETPKAGAKVREGSIVTLVVSNGPAPIKMPRLQGLTLDRARQIAAADGFTINVSERTSTNNIPPNVIASQDIPPGSTIPADHSATVNVVVSSGGGLAQVPSVVGSDYATALQQLQQAGFTVQTEYAKKIASSDNGQIIDQDPKAGTPAEKGTSVSVMLSVPGEVPDTNGLTLDDAKKVLVNAGYSVGNITPTTEGADGRVVRTEPEVGTELRPGTPVNIYINSASAQPPAP